MSTDMYVVRYRIRSNFDPVPNLDHAIFVTIHKYDGLKWPGLIL